MQKLKDTELNKVNQHIGNSRGEKTTKIHTLVDGLGNSLAFLFTGGQTHGAVPTIPLLEQINVVRSNILGGKGYGSGPIRE